jgi:hypothetical protein
MPDLIRDAWLIPLKDLVMTGIWFTKGPPRKRLPG